MDKIGGASKPFAARVEDLIENGRKKEQKKTVNKPTDDEEKDIDTKAFLLTEMKFGLEFVFRMSDPLFPGEMVPDFICKGLMGNTEKLVAKGD